MQLPAPQANSVLAGSIWRAGLPVTEDVVDGYPVGGLVESFLAASCSGSGTGTRERRVVGEVLSHWADILAHDIEQMPAISPPAVAAIRTRMLATQQALMLVRARLLGEDTGQEPRPGRVHTAEIQH